MGLWRILFMVCVSISVSSLEIDPLKVLHLLDLDIERPFVLSMGASWCPGCEQNRPLLQRIAQTTAVVYIHYDTDPNKSPNCALWYDYPDPKAEILKQTGIMALPTTVIIAENGESQCILGPLSRTHFEHWKNIDHDS